MEVVASGLVVIAVCAALGLIAIRSAGSGAEVVMLMFRSPAELGWPAGVQEDDDLHWVWSVPPTSPTEGKDSGPALLPDDARTRPEIVELAIGAGPLPSPVSRH
jgi:hypothetical protein